MEKTWIKKIDPKVMAEAERLAKSVYNGIERDWGYSMATWFGLDASKMTDEQLMAWGKVPFPKSDTCYECGQKLPQNP